VPSGSVDCSVCSSIDVDWLHKVLLAEGRDLPLPYNWKVVLHMNAMIYTRTLVLCVLSALAGLASAQEVKGNAAAAANKVAMCQGCHNIPGWRASFPEIHLVPQIAGQNVKYIEAALKAYRKGDRKHPTMRAIAETLTDQDIADLSAYYEQLGRGAQATASAK
jgi:cytochrome c553